MNALTIGSWHDFLQQSANGVVPLHVCAYAILFIALNVDSMFELGSSWHTVVLPNYMINNSEV